MGRCSVVLYAKADKASASSTLIRRRRLSNAGSGCAAHLGVHATHRLSRPASSGSRRPRTTWSRNAVR